LSSVCVIVEPIGRDLNFSAIFLQSAPPNSSGTRQFVLKFWAKDRRGLMGSCKLNTRSTKNWCFRPICRFIAGRPARSAAMPVLFLLNGPKIGFSPRRGTRCPDKRVRSPCQLSRLSGQKCGNTAPKTQNFAILARNLYLRSDSFTIFLRNSQRLYASIGNF